MRLADNFWELKELLNKTAIDYNIDVRVDEITADQLNQFFSALYGEENSLFFTDGMNETEILDLASQLLIEHEVGSND